MKVLEDCPGDLDFWYRHISKGAWPFSTADHGWPISDCTAEGLKVIVFGIQCKPVVQLLICNLRYSSSQAVLLLSKLPSDIVGEPIESKQLYDAVNVVLSLQVGWIKISLIHIKF